MELVDYARVLRRRWLLIVIAVVVSGGLAYWLSARQVPMYSTSTRLVVSAPAGGTAVSELSNRTLAISRAAAYASFAPTTPAVQAALRRAGYSPDGPRPQVAAAADGTTPFLLLSVSDVDPVRAAAVANAYVDVLLRVVADLDGTKDASGQRLAVLDAAGVPGLPVSPRPRRDAVIGTMLGLVLGIGAAFVREALDRTYTDPDDLERTTSLAVLGVVPQALEKVGMPTLTHPSSSRAEAYRTIRTNIQFAGTQRTFRRVVVTSATPGEGKTTVATNLAVALVKSGHSVVLIDADLRRPRVASAFLLDDPGPGLSGLLTEGLPLKTVVRSVAGGDLDVIPAGEAVPNPSELLGGARMVSLLTELEQRYDTVLLDTPPVLPVTDALVLAAGATGVLVVVRLGSTSGERLGRALASLRKLHVPVLGLVANGSVSSGDAAYGYGVRYGYEQRGRRAR